MGISCCVTPNIDETLLLHVLSYTQTHFIVVLSEASRKEGLISLTVTDVQPSPFSY